MMKKIFVGVICFWMFVFTNSFAASYTIDGYCARNTSYQCLWCLGGGSTQAGNCKSTYAGCTKGVTNVSVGSSSNGVKCTSSGFCYTSCSSQWIAHPSIPHMQVLQTCSGCKCSDCVSTSTVQCETGYEMVGDLCLEECPYGYERVGENCLEKCNNAMYRNEFGECVRCPQVLRKNTSGEYVDFYGMKVRQESIITWCFLPPVGEYKDETGEFTLDGTCYWTE